MASVKVVAVDAKTDCSFQTQTKDCSNAENVQASDRGNKAIV